MTSTLDMTPIHHIGPGEQTSGYDATARRWRVRPPPSFYGPEAGGLPALGTIESLQHALQRLQVLSRAEPASAYPPLAQCAQEYDGMLPTKPDE